MVTFGKSRFMAATLAVAALGALAAVTPAQAQTTVGINLSVPGLSLSAGTGAVQPVAYYPAYSTYPAPVAYPAPAIYPAPRQPYPVYSQPVRGWEHRHGWGWGPRLDRDRDHDGVPNRYDRHPDNPYRR